MKGAGNKRNEGTEYKILRAAEREFMDKGFAGARTTTIAEAAGVTHAMFHYYFRTKEKLFDRIISERVSILNDVVLKPIESDGLSLEVFIRNLINRHLDFLAANPDLPRFLISELYRNQQFSNIISRKIRQVSQTLTGKLQSVIDECADNGLCRRIDARMLLLDIVSLNVFAFMAAPVVDAALGFSIDDAAGFIAQRKIENYDTIMCKLKS